MNSSETDLQHPIVLKVVRLHWPKQTVMLTSRLHASVWNSKSPSFYRQNTFKDIQIKLQTDEDQLETMKIRTSLFTVE